MNRLYALRPWRARSFVKPGEGTSTEHGLSFQSLYGPLVTALMFRIMRISLVQNRLHCRHTIAPMGLGMICSLSWGVRLVSYAHVSDLISRKWYISAVLRSLDNALIPLALCHDFVHL